MLNNTVENVSHCVYKQMAPFQVVSQTIQQENVLKHAHHHLTTFLITQLKDVCFTVLKTR